MDKQIGFRRNIYQSWLDSAAAFSAETTDPGELRARLDPIVAERIPSRENRRMAIDIVVNIWGKSREAAPELHADAVAMFQTATALEDRVWLHYGLSLLTYSFFRDVAAAIGPAFRLQDVITLETVKRRLVAERGQLGALEKAVERVIFSLRDWGLVAPGEGRATYRAAPAPLVASSIQLETWLLACALRAHPAGAILIADLLRLPELFPFRFAVTIDDLRRSCYFEVERQGHGWDMVSLR